MAKDIQNKNTKISADESQSALAGPGEPEVYIDVAGVERSRPVREAPDRQHATGKEFEESDVEPLKDLPDELKPMRPGR